MKTLYLVLVGLLVSTDALAQNDPVAQPPQGLKGRTKAACTNDLARLCAGKSLKLECLVENWIKISSDCQDALAKPMHDGG